MTTPISITFDIDPLMRELSDTGKKQVPFALALALNRTAEEMQEAVRQRIFARGFVIRSAATARFLSNAIKIRRSDRATKTQFRAAVRIESSGKGGGRAGLLGFLEEGGVRYSQFAIGSGVVFGPGSVAVPIRPTPSTQVPRNLYPAQTGLQERRSISGGLTKASLRGKRRTFVVRTRPGEGLVLQRTGPGRRDTRALFVIKPRVRVQGRRFFFVTAERTAIERFDVNMDGFMRAAIRTAR